ncbi:hypothetical protein [Aureibacillus halotolerans]|uniref:Uncharacterized protein n=1 Tax=Aureibacillus halotolerans TaxID=1508390 RepID=A0A4R6TUF8_9BACI|nr:hypothetical protein [Aureibacillus halotolerans]TDQ37368.1 hypothetical protein EV213_1132 [Aureibacillus halotolerans]
MSSFLNAQEDHEVWLIVVTIANWLTLKKNKKLVRYQKKLQGQYKPY